MQRVLTQTADHISPDRRLFHRRPLCLAALGTLLGLLCFGAGDRQAAPALLAVLLLLALAACRLHRPALPVLLFACASLLSATLQCPVAPAASSGLLTGRIAEPPEREGQAQVVLLDQAALDGTSIRGRVQLTLSGAPWLAYGQELLVQSRLRTPDADWLYYDRYQGIACLAQGDAATLQVEPAQRDAYGLLLDLRTSVAARIDALFPNPEHASLARGILLGGSLAQTEGQTVEQFRAVGIAHLLAVSGLHVGVLAGALLLPLRLIRRIWLRFAVLAVCLFAYAALTAFTPSVLRACVMLLCTLPAVPLRRRLDLPSSLSLAFVLLLLLRPFALWHASFQLSFLAVFGIALLRPLLVRPLSVLGQQAASALATGLSVILATIPANARFFETVSVASLAANLLILPLVPLFLVPAALALLISCVWMPLGAALAILPQAALELMLRVAYAGGALALDVPAPSTAAYLLFLGGMLLASPLCLAATRKKLPASLAAFALAIILWR